MNAKRIRLLLETANNHHQADQSGTQEQYAGTRLGNRHNISVVTSDGKELRVRGHANEEKRANCKKFCFHQ